MSVPIPARRLTRAFSLRWCCTCLSAATLPAAAAAAAAAAAVEFAVSPAQMQALVISLQKLTQPGAIAGMRFPAKVVMPPNQQQMVSAPEDGVVDRLLVNGQDNVKAGQPLLRLVSPEYGQMQLKLMEAAAKARLPLQAVARNDERAYVFVRNAKGFVATRFAVLSSAGVLVQVSGKLAAGQEVATASVIALKAEWLGKVGGDK